jgi:hypothetical protein
VGKQRKDEVFPMSQRSVALRFGPGHLTRDDCVKCLESTLHKSGECIHCGHRLYQINPGDIRESLRSPFHSDPAKRIKPTFVEDDIL